MAELQDNSRKRDNAEGVWDELRHYLHDDVREKVSCCRHDDVQERAWEEEEVCRYLQDDVQEKV